MMSTEEESTLKRKPTEELELVISNSDNCDDDDDHSSKSKARRVSTDAQEATATSHQTTEEAPVVATATATAASTTIATPRNTLESVGQMIQDLFHSDNAKVNAALDALCVDLDKKRMKYKNIRDVGGCFALFHLLKNRLDKAMDRILGACDQVTELNEFDDELTTLYKTLNVIKLNFFFYQNHNNPGFAAMGGVETVVKIMKTFPKCGTLQQSACGVLRNLVCCSICKAKAFKSGGIEVILAVVDNHLGSTFLCREACLTLRNISMYSKETTGLLIRLGGATAVAQVRTKWADSSCNTSLRYLVEELTKLIIEEMNSWLR
jgi:hypothetical protein